MNTDSICLVLSGGGAKGIYHIGVWKALKELGVKIDAVVGNSIGAIIAAFLVEGRDAELEEIGSKIGLDFILNVPQDLIEDGDLKSDWHNLDDLKRLAGSVLSRKGLDTSPLRELLEANIHEQTIRNRGLDFGVVVYNLSDRKPREVFIEEMEEGELIHYVLASSAFPGFQRPEIAGKKYIDGGVYDNIPYAMAKARGYRNIIVVDISGLGVKRKLDIEGTRTTYIKNSIDMGGVLDFDRAFLDQFSHLGYLDTLRTYGRFRGRHYFLEEDDGLEDHFQRFLEDRDQSDQVRSLLPKYARYHRRWLPVLLDCAAKILSVERIRTWVYQDLFEVVESAAAEWRRGFEEASEADLKETMAIIRRELSDGVLVKTPYVYHLAVKRYLPKVLKQPTEKLLKDFSPELPGGLFLLDVLPEFLGSF